jgi:hypothetical protein
MDGALCCGEIELSLGSLLRKIQDAFSGKPQKKKLSVKSTSKKGKGPSECSRHFGYLASRAQDAELSQECLTCQKMLECRNM